MFVHNAARLDALELPDSEFGVLGEGTCPGH